MKRVTVEHRVADIDLVIKLQQQTGEQLAGFRPKPADDLHMTLYHFGKPEALWVEIQEAGSTIPFKEFHAYFIELLAAVEHIIPQPFELKVESLAEFGAPNDPAIVLKLELPGWLLDCRRTIRQSLTEMLTKCGLQDPAGFMDSSHNLHRELDEHFKPHVSLGRAPKDQTLADLQVEGLGVQLGPSHLRNVVVKG